MDTIQEKIKDLKKYDRTDLEFKELSVKEE